MMKNRNSGFWTRGNIWFIFVICISLAAFGASTYKNYKKGMDLRGNVVIDCAHPRVIGTVKKSIKRFGPSEIRISWISTIDEEYDYRECFGLFSVEGTDAQNIPVTYYVRRADNKKEYIVWFAPDSWC